jgi:hypothetical protein
MGHQTKLFAASIAALVIACIAGWAVSDSQAQARVAAIQIDPFTMMTNTKQLPSKDYLDYSFVF